MKIWIGLLQIWSAFGEVVDKIIVAPSFGKQFTRIKGAASEEKKEGTKTRIARTQVA